MSTVAHRPHVDVPPTQHFLLTDVAWNTYISFGNLLEGRNLRLTYDRGELEFMTLSPEHERFKHLIVLLLAILAEELNIEMAGYGSMTFRRDDLERGLEPDECYWIAHEAQIRGRNQIDLAIDPPPDLVVEVEITRNVLDQLPIFAALGVPEVWRWDGAVLRVLVLQSDGKFAECERSQAFPLVPMEEFARFLTPNAAESELKHLRAFRAWVQQERANWKTV
jgi:Uma2 family endonuclease